MNKILIFAGIVFAMVILFISITRANLETVTKEDREKRIRTVPVFIVEKKENGEEITTTYFLPKIKIYPSNILYPIKMIRDRLWLALTRNPCEKSKLLLLIADKQMAENDELSVNEAVDKIIMAYKICPNDRFEIEKGLKAYRQITSEMRKYNQANEKIKEFIEREKIIFN